MLIERTHTKHQHAKVHYFIHRDPPNADVQQPRVIDERFPLNGTAVKRVGEVNANF